MVLLKLSTDLEPVAATHSKSVEFFSNTMVNVKVRFRIRVRVEVYPDLGPYLSHGPGTSPGSRRGCVSGGGY